MGVGLERVAIRPVLRHALSLSWVLSTVAISIILKNAAVQLWGPEQIKFPSPFGDTVLRVGPAGIFPQELFIIVAATCTVLLVQVFLKRAVLGKALTAVAFNRNAAAVMGINVQRMIVLAFVISSALAGLGRMLFRQSMFRSA
jgi:branched-chain amino acid transport system permease protein